MHLILLHGAISSKEQFEFLLPLLTSHYILHPVDFTGHGGTDLPIEFTIPVFAEQILAYINQLKERDDTIQSANIHLFGYSMGGFVAMYLAKNYPEKIGKVITLATKFHWDAEIARREVAMLNPDTISTKIPAFADRLQVVHYPQNWRIVLAKTAEMLSQLGEENPLKLYDYRSITTQCMIMIGDRDKMVTLIETLTVYKELPHGQLAVLPNTHHLLEGANPHLLSLLIVNFLNG